MSNTVIEFENVSKQYRLGTIGTGTLTHDINRWWHLVRGKEDPYLQVGQVNDRSVKSTSDYVWALKDITFNVKQGEVVGIIGKNGAGKSTLLKILSRVTSPTTGSIRAKGRIASLLEVGTGFHGELTGRENIYMNGAILGMTKREITNKFDEIVSFSGIEKYVDTPVKRYSSGMTVRLGFAIAAHLEPEILVVDEVLAVGDAEFQKKAIGKMKDVSQGEGRTVLFVSHNMGSMRSLCNRGVVLGNGMVEYVSPSIDDAISYYSKADESTVLPIRERKDRSGSGRLRVTEFKFVGGTSPYNISTGDPICIELEYESEEQDISAMFYISINDAFGVCVLFLDSSVIHDFPTRIKSRGKILINLPVDFTIREGQYFINIAAFVDGNMADYIQKAASLEVENGGFFFAGKTPAGKGLCYVKQNWNVSYE